MINKYKIIYKKGGSKSNNLDQLMNLMKLKNYLIIKKK